MSHDQAHPPETPFEVNAPYAPTRDNRPAALEHSPLALTRESNSQMSFGERAALEGILAQLHPQLAIEIGTAEGGSLQRIAAYSKEVHSIDLDHGQLAVKPSEHVHFHTGPSAEILPALLRQFADSGRSVDLALVDGDHSFAGVVKDIQTLLDSPATTQSVILVHDSMNGEIRAGIESIGLDDYEKVVYHELDFVPGYVYREGVARDSIWGGIALILCDAHRSVAYSSSTRQWRYHEPFAAIHRMRTQLLASPEQSGWATSSAEHQNESAEELSMLKARLAAAEDELESRAEALEIVYRSRSWRLTAPLRAAARRIRNRVTR